MRPSENGPSEATSNAIEALRQQMLRTWWRVTLGLWLTVGLFSLWQLRSDFQLWLQYFTWTAVRYALAYNRLASLGLGLCVGLTVALLINESRHMLWGMTPTERARLEQQLAQIDRQGPSHPLWRIVNQSPESLR
ncbi:MAG: hypothetical protein F6J97_06080 [Leptolyngbya sp. SIO4C1]|nr:hypothetical protein [Leptolyngbya sp. SIO4C1]